MARFQNSLQIMMPQYVPYIQCCCSASMLCQYVLNLSLVFDIFDIVYNIIMWETLDT